uniref:Putative HNH homing endonuclease n=1 Tax=Uronema confervicola TaxID=764120 RepID=A0A6H1U5L1_9CHLO|nr:putative HNH homing endonuclease [Uronema confervicola]QIZ74188.1 putative HNH homing endonuclease [Uronema confervicola]
MRKSKLFYENKKRLAIASTAFFLNKLKKKYQFVLFSSKQNFPQFFEPKREEKAFNAFKNYMDELFQKYGLNKQKRLEYLNKIEEFLKDYFYQFFLNSNEQTQLLLLEEYNYLKHAETIHNMYATFLKNLDNTTGGRPELYNTVYQVVHHIIPRFEGGSNEQNNRIQLHQYEHALIHLFRFSWKQSSSDLNAFSSGCLDDDQLSRRNRPELSSVENARAKTTRNPEWQATAGARGRANRSKPALTPALQRSGSKAGKQYQFENARQRVNPFTWLFCEFTVGFKNIATEEIVWVEPNEDPKSRTVAFIAQFLSTKNPSQPIPEKQVSNLSVLFRGERPTKWGWSLYGLKFDTNLVELTRSEISLLEKAFATVVVYTYRDSPVNEEILRNSFNKRFSTVFTSVSSDILFTKMYLFMQMYLELVLVGSTNANKKYIERFVTLYEKLDI